MNPVGHNIELARERRWNTECLKAEEILFLLLDTIYLIPFEFKIIQ